MWSVRVTVKWAGHVICMSDSEMPQKKELWILIQKEKDEWDELEDTS